MHLVLLRHGESTGVSSDPPLSAAGRSEVGRTVEQLKAMNFSPDRIVHSGLRRAEETAGIAGALLGAGVTQSDGLLPEDDIHAAAARFEAERTTTLAVTHQPFITGIASLLLEGRADRLPVRFSTATAALLERTDGSWRLVAVITPAGSRSA